MSNAPRALRITDLGQRSYRPVLDLQNELVEARREERIPDTLLFVEHSPVFTLGRNADASHILFSEEEREARGIDTVHIGRGGDVTYHGPGQLVGYPILDLRSWNRRILWYISGLESALIRTLEEFGIAAGTDPINRGVWVGRNKIAAIGVRIRRHITMHGFALNVRTDLANYAGIVPCGIASRGVTSMHTMVPDVSMGAVKEAFTRHFMSVFGYGRTVE